MNKIVNIKIFNNILDNFISFIEGNFPQVRSQLLLSKNSLEFVRKANPRMVVEQFMIAALPYRKNIFDCDQDFFIKEYDSKKNEDDFLSSLNLKEVWLADTTSDIQKAQIFLYFQQLIKAGEKC